MSESGSSQSRFQHLLQPIRDLSKNWSIDIAQDLEEYLEELETVTIIFDAQEVDEDDENNTLFGASSQSSLSQSSSSSQSRRRVMNFAEAALLIQGTSMIYSRKVEYLYALVYQTLAHLSHQQNQSHQQQPHDGAQDEEAGEPNPMTAKKAGAGGRQNAPIGGAFANLVFEDPLPIVQELREAHNITLPRDKANSTTTGALKRGMNHQNYQAALTLMTSLVPNEKDLGESFKLLCCSVHPSGTLLLDDCSKKYVTERLVQTSASTTADRTVVRLNFDELGNDKDQEAIASYEIGDTDNHMGEHDDLNLNRNQNQEELNQTINDTALNLEEALNQVEGHDDDDDDDDNDGCHDGDDGISMPMDEQDVPRTPEKTRLAQPPFAPVKPAKDPWARLDPFDASDAVVRPFRKEKTYKKPRRVGLIGSSSKSKNGCKEDPLVRFQMNALAPQLVGDSKWMQEPDLYEMKYRRWFCKPQFPLLQRVCDDVWQLEAKWSRMLKTLQAQELKSADAVLMTETPQETTLAMAGSTLASGTEPVTSTELEWDVLLDIGDDVMDHNDDDDDDNVDVDPRGDDGGIELTGSSENDAMTKEALETLLADPQPEEDSYEAICRKHIESFMKGTEKYIRETDLSRKVAEWEDKLSPLLKEQDNHPPFDIHKCGKQIVQKLEHETKPKPKSKTKHHKQPEPSKVPFEQLVQGMEPYQVCRMFLASLQLANSGNVQLVHAKTALDQQNVPFEMKLLSSALVHDRQ